MKIYTSDRKEKEITNLDEWFDFCPPQKGEGQWKDGCSAKEMAKYWLEQNNHDQFKAFIQQKVSDFDYDYIVPEYESVFDGYRSPRKHDLFIAGKNTSAIITVESKVEESFGDGEFGENFKVTIDTKKITKNSNALDRMINLYQTYFHNNGDILNIMYQLTYWFAGSINDAIKYNIKNIVMVLQEFKTEPSNKEKLAKNLKEFEKFICFISEEKYKTIEANQIIGPIENQYTSGKSLHIGYYSI
jgi:hypothetical protein